MAWPTDSIERRKDGTVVVAWGEKSLSDEVLDEFVDTRLEGLCRCLPPSADVLECIVDISGNYLQSPKVLAKLLRSVRRAPLHVTSLRLHKNKFTDVVAAVLVEHIQMAAEAARPLMELHLSGNALTVAGVEALVRVAHDCRAYPRAMDAPKLTSLGNESLRKALWLRAEHQKPPILEAEALLYNLGQQGYHVTIIQKGERVPNWAVVQMHMGFMQPPILPEVEGGKGKGTWGGRERGWDNSSWSSRGWQDWGSNGGWSSTQSWHGRQWGDQVSRPNYGAWNRQADHWWSAPSWEDRRHLAFDSATSSKGKAKGKTKAAEACGKGGKERSAPPKEEEDDEDSSEESDSDSENDSEEESDEETEEKGSKASAGRKGAGKGSEGKAAKGSNWDKGKGKNKGKGKGKAEAGGKAGAGSKSSSWTVRYPSESKESEQSDLDWLKAMRENSNSREAQEFEVAWKNWGKERDLTKMVKADRIASIAAFREAWETRWAVQDSSDSKTYKQRPREHKDTPPEDVQAPDKSLKKEESKEDAMLGMLEDTLLKKPSAGDDKDAKTAPFEGPSWEAGPPLTQA